MWDLLVTDLFDAFPDFLDQYQLFVCLVQELFIVIRQLILDTKRDMIVKIGTQLKLLGGEDPKEEKAIKALLETNL